MYCILLYASHQCWILQIMYTLQCTHIKAASNSDMYTISVKSTGLPNKCMVASSSSEPGLHSRRGCPWNKAVWAGLLIRPVVKQAAAEFCCVVVTKTSVKERVTRYYFFFLFQRCHLRQRVVTSWSMIIGENVASKRVIRRKRFQLCWHFCNDMLKLVSSRYC